MTSQTTAGRNSSLPTGKIACSKVIFEVQSIVSGKSQYIANADLSTTTTPRRARLFGNAPRRWDPSRAAPRMAVKVAGAAARSRRMYVPATNHVLKCTSVQTCQDTFKRLSGSCMHAVYCRSLSRLRRRSERSRLWRRAPVRLLCREECRYVHGDVLW